VSRALLDVNVLLALFDQDHADHARARTWLESEIRHGWASCAITQNGFARIICQRSYPSPVPPRDALGLLAEATATSHHDFWPCSVSLADPDAVDARHVQGSRQLTDVYLLALAAEQRGRLVTFDRSMPLAAARQATAQHLVVL
jgi:hypothetical protein